MLSFQGLALNTIILLIVNVLIITNIRQIHRKRPSSVGCDRLCFVYKVRPRIRSINLNLEFVYMKLGNDNKT